MKSFRFSSLLFALAIFFAIGALAVAQEAASPAFRSVNFDHTKTGFPLTGIHATVRCETCHTGGMFKGTPKECAGCHSNGVRAGATPKPADHVQTAAPCDYCHKSTATFQGALFNHTGITNNCASCHNGITALGKSSSHIATTSPCETCHTNTVSFTGAAMYNHLDSNGVPITSGCASCHNGSTAIGKST